MGALIGLAFLYLCCKIAGGFFKFLLSIMLFCILIAVFPAALAVYLFIIIPLGIIFLIFD